MLLRSSRWVISEKKKVRRRQQTIQSDETYELPPPLSSVMEKGGHCRQVMRRGAHGQRGVDVAALLLLLAERHLLRRYSKSHEFSLSLRYSSYLCSTALLLRCIVSIVGMAGAGHPPCLMIAGETEKCPHSTQKPQSTNERGLLRFYARGA